MEGTANCRARSPDCCDLQEGGGGENHRSHFEKGRGVAGGCIKRRWVSWYVTRLPQQPRSLRNRLWRSGRSRSGGGERQQLAGIHSQLFCVVMATAETQTFHRLRFNLKAKRCVENKPIKPCRNLQLTVLKRKTIPLASKRRQH